MLISISYGGVLYANYSAQDLEAAGVPVDVVSQAVSDSVWASVRDQRNSLIAASDWTQMPDSPLTAEQRAAWADYRQALRDIPELYDDPDSVVWPEEPA